MTDSVLPQVSSKNQVYKQAGLFPEDGEIIFLTKTERKSAYDKTYCADNKHKRNTQSKAYYKSNKDKVKEQSKARYIANPDKIKEQSKVRYIANPDKKIAQSKLWHIANPEKNKACLKKYFLGNAQYDAYSDRLLKYENIFKDSNGTLLVVCAYCGKLYVPSRMQVKIRIRAINETLQGESRFYCSQLCKIACPTFNQRKHYRFQHIGHSREVPAEFRHMALLDRNYTCENCGSDETGLHVHHILGYTESPMTAADLSNIKVLCENCHKAVHSIPGCFYVDYSCKHQKD